MSRKAIDNWRQAAPPGFRRAASAKPERPEAVFSGFVRVLERLAPGPPHRPSPGGPAFADRIFQEKP